MRLALDHWATGGGIGVVSRTLAGIAWRRSIGLVLGMLTLGTLATRSEAAERGVHAEQAQRKPRGASRQVPPEPAAPEPVVRLTLVAPTARGPWSMRVTNEDNVPVRIVADARALWLEVTPRGASQRSAAVRCSLPEDMRPAGDLERALVVPPRRSYVETFEPRLYCFGNKELDALTAGATVVGYLGWSGRAGTPPFEVTPIDGVEQAVSPRKAIASAAVTLPDEPPATPAPAVVPPVIDADPYPPRLKLTGAAHVEALSSEDVQIPLVLHNDGTRPITVRFRPETVRFDVVSSAGVESCSWPAQPSAPTYEVFETIEPKGAATLDVVLSAYCTGHSLDQAGLLVVRPRLDTRQASGSSLGLSTFDGEIIATKPTLVRLHRGALEPQHLKPQLEPESPASAPPSPPPSPAPRG